MQILLLGATGRTGIQVLKESLNRNHKITALARNPETLETNPSIINHPNRPTNLITIAGSPLNKSDISTALIAAASRHGPVDVIITTLNPRRASDSPFAAVDPTDSPPRMMADSIVSVLAALDEYSKTASHKTPKIIALSALGAGSSAPQTNFLFRLLFRKSNMVFTYEDHDAVEVELVRQQKERGPDGGAVPYVLVRPTRLVEEGGAEARVFEGKGTVGMMETISRAAVARFLVDAAEKQEWDWKAPIIIG
ncbi:NAD-dependent epimerase/dehydratase [Diaporthe sp. PMI_573]|nr:NAD-dependent epimerase/dehydratase [Diaporthaceae sp. PMI_573]